MRIDEERGAPTNKYSRKIGPVAGRQAVRAKVMSQSSDPSERMHGAHTLGVLSRRLASRATGPGKTKPRNKVN